MYSRQMREKFGEFFSFGRLPMGSGLHGTIHVLIDPEEMLKVVRSEGAYPSGAVSNLWLFRGLLKNNKSPLIEMVQTDRGMKEDFGLLDVGERWKKHRTFLQTGMLDPKAAKGFIPGIVQAAELASKNILKASQNPNINLNQFLNYCSFDMFSSFMLGEMARSTESAVSIDQDHNENAIFCKSAVSLMETSSSLQRTPYEYIMNKVGIQTTGTKKAQELWNTVHRIGKAKYERNRSDLNELEKASYYAGALTRWHNEQAASSNSISKGEIMDLCIFALFAGVDTTSNVLAWNLMHLALNPGVQEKLYKELSINTASSDGRITQQTLERSTSPYLHAFIRETNRITPPFPDPLMKRNSQKEVEVHGITFPKNTVFFLRVYWKRS